MDVAMSHLLISNDPPSPSRFARAKLRIRRLEGDISELEAIVSRLDALKRELDGYRGVVSLLRRTPQEILGLIFLSFPFIQGSKEPPTTSGGARKGLVQLMLVCKAWREAAIATHSLWATLSLDGLDCRALADHKVLAWLSRAGDLPRRISVFALQPMDCPLGSNILRCRLHCAFSKSTPLARLLWKGSFTTIELYVQHAGCIENFVDRLWRVKSKEVQELPSPLKTLGLYVTNEEARPMDLPFISLFPSIVHLRLMGVNGFATIAKVGGLSERLTALHLHLDPTPNPDPLPGVLTALSKCVNLEILHLFYTRVPSDTDSTPSVHLRELTYLGVHAIPRGNGGLDLSGTLGHFKLPSLRTVDVSSSPETTSNAFDSFFKSHPHIKTLICRDTGTGPIQAALSHLHSLAQLRISKGPKALRCFGSNMKQSRTWRQQFLPRLEHLELLGIEDGSEMTSALERLAARRQGRKKDDLATLKGIVLGFATSQEGEALTIAEECRNSAAVRALRASGVTITVSP